MFNRPLELFFLLGSALKVCSQLAGNLGYSEVILSVLSPNDPDMGRFVYTYAASLLW